MFAQLIALIFFLAVLIYALTFVWNKSSLSSKFGGLTVTDSAYIALILAFSGVFMQYGVYFFAYVTNPMSDLIARAIPV